MRPRHPLMRSSAEPISKAGNLTLSSGPEWQAMLSAPGHWQWCTKVTGYELI